MRVIEIYIRDENGKLVYFRSTTRFKTCKSAREAFVKKYSTLGLLETDVHTQFKPEIQS
jgi:hypothetical protein